MPSFAKQAGNDPSTPHCSARHRRPIPGLPDRRGEQHLTHSAGVAGRDPGRGRRVALGLRAVPIRPWPAAHGRYPGIWPPTRCPATCQPPSRPRGGSPIQLTTDRRVDQPVYDQALGSVRHLWPRRQTLPDRRLSDRLRHPQRLRNPSTRDKPSPLNAHPGLPLDQRADRRALVLADDEILLPMPGLRAVIRLERPLADGEHGLPGPRAPPAGMLMRPAVITPGAQRGRPVGRQRRWP
jgi:hypothetical protein